MNHTRSTTLERPLRRTVIYYWHFICIFIYTIFSVYDLNTCNGGIISIASRGIFIDHQIQDNEWGTEGVFLPPPSPSLLSPPFSLFPSPLFSLLTPLFSLSLLFHLPPFSPIVPPFLPSLSSYRHPAHLSIKSQYNHDPKLNKWGLRPLFLKSVASDHGTDTGCVVGCSFGHVVIVCLYHWHDSMLENSSSYTTRRTLSLNGGLKCAHFGYDIK